jgi:hypothetical protein
MLGIMLGNTSNNLSLPLMRPVNEFYDHPFIMLMLHDPEKAAGYFYILHSSSARNKVR